MARSTFPSEGSASRITGGAGRTIKIYTDAFGVTLADIQTTGGVTISGSTVTLDANSNIPQFLGPDGVTTLYARIDNSSFRLSPYAPGVRTGSIGSSTSGVSDWAPSTAYVAGQLVLQAGALYRAKTSFTSGGSFVGSNWDALSAYETAIHAAASFVAKADAIDLEGVQDSIAGMLTSGTHTGASVSYDDAAGTLSLNVTGGSAGALPRAMLSGRYYPVPIGALSAVVVSPGYVYVGAFEVFASTSFTEVSINVATAGTGVLRVGVYADNGGVPGALIFETAAQADVSTTGTKTLAITQTLPKSIYWIATLHQGASGPQLTTTNANNAAIGSATLVGAMNNNCAGYSDVGGHTSGAMPTTLTGLVQSVQVPRAVLKTA
jgi:hypothetical protein